MTDIFYSYLKRYSIPIILPAVFLLITTRIQIIRGAFYNLQDPDYAYLLNSLNILNGVPPGHIDHPGVTLHLFGAVIIWFKGLFLEDVQITYSVLSDPENYLQCINSALLALIFLTSYFSGIFIYKKMRSVFIVVAFQISILSSPAIFLSSIRVMPEPLLIVIALLTFMLLFKKEFFESFTASTVMAFILGCLAGCGMATKITYFPFIIIPFFLMVGVINHLIYLFIIVVVFCLLTIPILRHYPYMINWIKSIIFHLDRYGHGKEGIIDIQRFSRHLFEIAENEPFMVFSVIVSVLFVLIGLKKKGVNFLSEYYIRVILGLATAMFVQIIMVAKHPGDDRYLIPSLLIPAPLFGFIYLYFNRYGDKPISLKMAPVGIILTIFLLIPVLRYDYREYLEQNKTNSSIYGALYHYADYWSGKKYTKLIKEIYDNK